jgi:hypothetical protein
MNDVKHVSKKCHGCYTYAPIDAKECTACGKKLGPVDKTGMAQKPIDWMAYVVFLVSLCGFALFIWWAFFSGMERP